MKSAIVKTMLRGEIKWQVNLRKRLTGDTSYHRRYFNTKKEATKFYNRVTEEITLHGVAFAKLSDPVRAGLAKFYAFLKSKNLSLEDAAQLVEKHQATSLSVTKAIAGFYADCTDGRLEKGTMREYRSQLQRFELKFGNKHLVSITKKDINEWLEEIKVKDRTKKNYITTLRTFFEYCVREETIDKNPAKLVRKPKENAKSPPILTIEEVRQFALYICRHESRLVAPIAIALFAGVRMSELFQLLWSDIDFVKRQIHIRKEISKKPKQKERWIKMSDNLNAWLALCKKQNGKICDYPTLDNLWDRRTKAFKKATGKAWPKNGARHSFASYTWTLGRDVDHLSNQMGNSPYVAEKYYIAGVEEEKGELYLQVMPEQKEERAPDLKSEKLDSVNII